jgi:hypothetical protein
MKLILLLQSEKLDKLDSKWKGPFRVIKKVFANVYEIEDLRTKKKVWRDDSSLSFPEDWLP